MRVVLTGGASGGHLVPLEPIIDTLRALYAEEHGRLPAWVEKGKLQLYFLGILSEEARTFFARHEVRAIHISSGKLRRYPSPHTLADIFFRLPFGIVLALVRMWSIMPDVVISKGGFGSVPVTLAAVFYRIPLILHESDAASGLANRIMARWASVITVGFAATNSFVPRYKNKTFVTGTPVRLHLEAPSIEAAKQTMGLPADVPVLLVMGGSQGAQQLNDVIVPLLPSLLRDMSVVHLTGADHLQRVQKSAAELLPDPAQRARYKPFGYVTEEMGNVLTAADVVVTRAGATALAELARLRKAIIVVPLDLAAQDHQRANARIFEAAGAARVIDPANLGRALLEQNIRSLIADEKLRTTLESNIAHLDHPQAARDIAQLSFQLVRGLVPRQQQTPAPKRTS